jgi:acetyltransferase-like isoleucine patch superfamily enzyme
VEYLRILPATPRVVFRESKLRLLHWLRSCLVQCRYGGLVVVPPVFWSYDDLDAISIGEGVTIGPFSQIVVTARSPFTNVEGRLTLDDRVHIGGYANVLAAGGEIRIGRDTLIAQFVSIVAANHGLIRGKAVRDQRWDESKTGVIIGENVWIGAGVTILPGCNVGHNSVIGAGSVVTADVPPDQIWAGVPARKLRDIE